MEIRHRKKATKGKLTKLSTLDPQGPETKTFWSESKNFWTVHILQTTIVTILVTLSRFHSYKVYHTAIHIACTIFHWMIFTILCFTYEQNFNGHFIVFGVGCACFSVMNMFEVFSYLGLIGGTQESLQVWTATR